MKTRCLAAALALVLGFAAFAQERKPKGVVMDVTQKLKMGHLSVTIEGKQSFLPPASFRLTGTVAYAELGIEGALVVVSNGAVVKQYVETMLGPQALTVDLAKIQEKLPDYDPADDYDPMRRQSMLARIAEKKTLPAAKMDGVPVEGYEFRALDLGVSPIPESLAMLSLPKPEKYRVWVNPRDGVWRKMEAEDATGLVFFTMTFTNVKTGVDLPPDTFTYEFPEGVTPADWTDMALGAATPRAAPVPAPEPENPRASDVEAPLGHTGDEP